MFDQHHFDFLYNAQDDSIALVIMMCGVAGAGKTTFSQQLEKEGFIRLSIDEEIWATKGRYGVDFPMDEIEIYKDEAERKLRKRLVQLIHEKERVVVDYSFWNRDRRDQYKQLIEKAGGKWKLIYLKVDPDVLRERLKIRNKRFDANAFPITEDILSTYIKGFDVPNGEGEIVIEN